MSIKLLRPKGRVVGSGAHHSGWPWVMEGLRAHHDFGGILFDDFAEASFTFHMDRTPVPHVQPWVGVFHHVFRDPWGLRVPNELSGLLSNFRFRQSLPYLRLALTTSRYAADQLRPHLPCPVIPLKHPIREPNRVWSERAFRLNPDKRVVQLGWYLRNTRAIDQLPTPEGFVKCRGDLDQRYHAEVSRHPKNSPHLRPRVGAVLNLPRLDDGRYEEMLCRDVMFLELVDSSANNAVLECLVRSTPLIVNRHPAVVEYLGPDYPLFYDRWKDAPTLFEPGRIVEGSRYLAGLDKSEVALPTFVAGVLEAVTHLDVCPT